MSDWGTILPSMISRTDKGKDSSHCDRLLSKKESDISSTTLKDSQYLPRLSINVTF